MNRLIKSETFNFYKCNLNNEKEEKLKIFETNIYNLHNELELKKTLNFKEKDSFYYSKKGISIISEIFQFFNSHCDKNCTIKINNLEDTNDYTINCEIIVSPPELPDSLVVFDSNSIVLHSSSFGSTGVGKSILSDTIMLFYVADKLKSIYKNIGDFVYSQFKINDSTFFVIILYDLVIPEILFFSCDNLNISNLDSIHKLKLDYEDETSYDVFIKNCCLQLLFPKLDKENHLFLFEAENSFEDKVSLGKMISI